MAMEWSMFRGWVSGLVTQRAEDWTFGPIDVTGMRGVEQISSEPVADGAAYLSLFVRSMRIVEVRKLTTKFYAVVHAFTALNHLSGEPAHFHVLTTPGQLQELDPANIDSVVTMNRRMLGPIPYRAGDFEINLALLSVKSADLAAPYIKLLQSISTQAGSAFVNAMLPFAEPLSQGIALLIGAQNGSILQVGVSTTFARPMTGYYVVMRAPQASIDLSTLRLDQSYHLTDSRGQPVQKYPYIVFSVSATAERGDWFMIPELSAAHKALQAAVVKGNQSEVDDAFAVFKRVTLTSPDLLRQDAKAIVANVDAELQGLGSTLTASGGQALKDLKDIPLYG
jgi:hypothetical protein